MVGEGLNMKIKITPVFSLVDTKDDKALLYIELPKKDLRQDV